MHTHPHTGAARVSVFCFVYLKACCVSLSCAEHLLLTSWPTLRAEEDEEEVEEEEEAWWRGLCRWGMWSRLGCDDVGPV